MRSVFLLLFAAFIILAGVLVMQPLFSPCDYPFHYVVGSVDPKFDISKQEFIIDTQEAANVWDNADGKNLFVYDPKATFTINLVYDERQALNSQVNNLNTQLNSEKSSLDPEIAKYNALNADFQKRVATLNAEIDYWNGKGGAPQGEYDKLIQEQTALKQEADQLNQMAKNLNQSTQQYNIGVNQLNKTINVYDQTIQNKPEEGLYQPALNKIDIYYNNGHTELVHTLAHELGHTLGLNHEPDPNAIMYYQTNLQITPAPQDLAQLKNICQKRSVYDLLKERIQFIMQEYFPQSNPKSA